MAGGAIEVERLSKRYGPVRALEGVSFRVVPGECLAYLGPNGAGKTTTVNVLCGLIPRDEGRVSVCGMDIDRDPVGVKASIGVVPEESTLYPELSCRRNLEFVGELYGLPRADRRARAGELLEQFDLADRAGSVFRDLSRGLKRRLTVAAALVHRPQVVFLDEPTAGLDVPSARSLRSLVRSIHRGGATVFLTTHNLAEAEALSDRVLILVKGRIAAGGTADEIRRRAHGTRRLSVMFSAPIEGDALCGACPSVRAAVSEDGTWWLEVAEADAALREVVAFASDASVKIENVAAGGASLEDAFMSVLEGQAPAAREEGPR
jgi:ABC-2 type transport system ATP-binding protein